MYCEHGKMGGCHPCEKQRRIDCERARDKDSAELTTLRVLRDDLAALDLFGPLERVHALIKRAVKSKRVTP